MQSVTFSQIGAFLACLVVILGIAVAIKLLFTRTPPMHREYLTREDHEQFRKETNDELKRHAARRAEIYDEQKRQGAALAGLQTETSNQTETLKEVKAEQAKIRDRIDELPKRTIDLLRSSGAIK